MTDKCYPHPPKLTTHQMVVYEFLSMLGASSDTYNELCPFFELNGCWFDQDYFEEILDYLWDFAENQLSDYEKCGLHHAKRELGLLMSALEDQPQLYIRTWENRMEDIECACSLNQPDNFEVAQPTEEMLNTLFDNNYDQQKSRLLYTTDPMFVQSLLIWSGKDDIAVIFKDNACIISEDATDPETHWVSRFIELAQQIRITQQ